MIEISVTADDIEHGVQSDCFSCPIARAVDRATGGDAHVYGGSVMLLEDRLVTDLPEDADRRIHAFDAGEGMEPFSFELPDLNEWDVEPDEDDDA